DTRPVIDEQHRLPVRRKVLRLFHTRPFIEGRAELFSGPQTEDVRRTAAAVAAIKNRASVERPHRRSFIERCECHTLGTFSIQVEDPDVGHALFRIDDAYGITMAIGRETSVGMEYRASDRLELRARSVHPDQAGKAERDAPGQYSVLGNTEGRVPRRTEIMNVRGHRLGLTGGSNSIQVEGLGHQGTVPSEQKIAVGVVSARVDRQWHSLR